MEEAMKTTFIFLVSACLLLLGCDKTDDEVRSEKAAKAQADKNLAAHEKRQ